VKVTIRGDLALLAAVSAQRLAIRMGSMGASVLKILQMQLHLSGSSLNL
jgi:hypothetical protein